MRNLREQRINRGRFQGFRLPTNMWSKCDQDTDKTIKQIAKR